MSWLQHVNFYTKSGQPFVIATITKTLGSSPRKMGAKIIVGADRSFKGSIGGGQLEALVLGHAAVVLKNGQGDYRTFDLCAKSGQCCGGIVDVFFEICGASPKLTIFGAGHIGTALSRVLADTSFDVCLVDHRKEWIDSEKIPSTITCKSLDYLTYAKTTQWREEMDFVLVVTPSHHIDLELMEFFCQQDLRFLGLVGSRTKWAKFKSKLLQKGLKMSDLEKVNCPVGEKFEGEVPQEIAISIASAMFQKRQQVALKPNISRSLSI